MSDLVKALRRYPKSEKVAHEAAARIEVLEALARGYEADGVAQGAREAFRAGWYINAAVDDHFADYLKGCEEVDWSEYAKAALAPEQEK